MPLDPRHPPVIIPERSAAVNMAQFDRRIRENQSGSRARVPIAPFVSKVNDRIDLPGQIVWRNDGYMWSQFSDNTWYYWNVFPGVPSD